MPYLCTRIILSNRVFRKHSNMADNIMDTSEPSFDEIVDTFEKTEDIDSENTLMTLFGDKAATNIHRDLEIFDSNNPVFHSINKCSSKFGEHCLKERLKEIEYNVDVLKCRQESMRAIDVEQVTDLMKDVVGKESRILWFWKKHDEQTETIFDSLYFRSKFLAFLNTNEFIIRLWNIYNMVIIPITTAFSPIVAALVPFILMKLFGKRFGMDVSFGTLLKLLKNAFCGGNFLSFLPTGKYTGYFKIFSQVISLFMYFHSVYGSVMQSKTINRLTGIIHKKLNDVFSVVNVARKLLNMQMSVHDCGVEKAIGSLGFVKRLDHDLFKQDPYFMSDKGVLISRYYQIVENKDRLIPILRYIGMIDMYCGIKLLGYPCATYSDKTCLNIRDLYHPSLNNRVKNKLRMRRNMLITGPNAAGKSTFIKSVAINVLLAQTFGVGMGITLKPFKIIETYLNICDVKGKESLFEAEMHRCRDYIAAVKELDANESAFIVMDEVFSSTNYTEGYAGAYAICKKLGQMPNCLSLVTTHYTKLSKLRKCGYDNYKFCADIDGDSIKYPYKIEKGVSKQFLALRILKNNGFDDDIIKTAIKIASKN